MREQDSRQKRHLKRGVEALTRREQAIVGFLGGYCHSLMEGHHHSTGRLFHRPGSCNRAVNRLSPSDAVPVEFKLWIRAYFNGPMLNSMGRIGFTKDPGLRRKPIDER